MLAALVVTLRSLALICGGQRAEKGNVETHERSKEVPQPFDRDSRSRRQTIPASHTCARRENGWVNSRRLSGTDAASARSRSDDLRGDVVLSRSVSVTIGPAIKPTEQVTSRATAHRELYSA
jgi:hypothetical protein